MMELHINLLQLRLNFFNYAIARGNHKFVQYFLDELDRVMGGSCGGG